MLFSERKYIKLERKHKRVRCLVTNTTYSLANVSAIVWTWADRRILDYFWERYWN